MADMHLTVSNSAYDHDKFDVSVTGLNHSDARQLVDIGNKLIFNAPSPRLEGSDLTYVQERALIEAAKLFFASKRDKISTIKFIRELSSLSLKGAKDLVDFALGYVVAAPVWMKSAA
ncbi:MAG TPA: hypothetical protein VN828_04975 [Acidobacteriaceae bacterium]|nr:hypothetical protein [Acidobacteriaceae bacterium]